MKKLTLIALIMSALIVPSHASVVVTNGLTHHHQVRPSSTEKGMVILKNIGQRPERIVVYINDLGVSCEDENLNIKDPGSEVRSNSDWVSVGFQERVLAPGEEFPLRYVINTPTSDLSGTYWSLLMVEVKKPIDTNATNRGVQITSNIRYAIQVITDFGSTQPTDVEFSAVEYTTAPEGKVLAVQLSNSCDKLVKPVLKLEVYDENGEMLFETKAETKKLYPGQCRRFMVPVEGLVPGKYQAILVADCGESDLFGITINLDVDE